MANKDECNEIEGMWEIPGKKFVIRTGVFK
jgi:hypothetical protein